ncbi:unnamed protein product [Rotaria sp. Silwood2]|nr:unnamed protein product [Rotaria sp. Silwood2]CAF3272262.1 unnamed protein product [Rotaria sp. Silwood2]CAF3940848.1 unnamed protein product [Rotaria sp. Silwood2]CAF4399584.1 unnamed protein product [Rotaria sp. Silwood2]
MIVQPALIISKQHNQPNRECLYAWYPEVVNDISMKPRDIYIHNGIDKDLLEQKPLTNGLVNTSINTNTSVELLQRYKQSIAPSDRAYHSTDTINEALNPPWALHYEIKRQAVTPNLLSNSTDMSIHEEPPRRLKSAPVTHSLPSTAILTIPEPRFINSFIPVTTINPIPSPTRAKTRASSAKARLNTTIPNEINQQQQRREIKSAYASRQKVNTKLSDEEIQQIFKRVYGDDIKQTQAQQEEPVQIIYTQPQPLSVSSSPVYIYQKSASWCADEPSSMPVRKSVEINPIVLNPHHIHRPAIIAVKNTEKNAVLKEYSPAKKSTKYQRRLHHSQGRRNEPLLAVTPVSHKSKLSLEIDGVKLIYDPKITFEDKSTNITKYFIDGRLYLVKDKRYNVIDNIDPSTLEKYNQSLAHSSRTKYYRTIPMEKFQIPRPLSDLHRNSSETYCSNRSSKHVHRYVIDPNLMSENLNVNKMSLSNRPPTAIVYA